MVVQRTLDNLKEKPHEEKRVVAGGIAVSVVVILFLVWGFIFLRNIQQGGEVPTLQGAAVPEDQLNAQFVGEAQQQLQNYYQHSQDQLREVRDNAAGDSTGVDAGAGVAPNADSSGFGAQNNDI